MDLCLHSPICLYRVHRDSCAFHTACRNALIAAHLLNSRQSVSYLLFTVVNIKLQFDHVVRNNSILSLVLVFRLCVYSLYYQRINTVSFLSVCLFALLSEN